jgi:nitroimidazol reductase NimA-like FMN-containing flavoprotein (pyridoxamine 5'-phosphate oxidase superfamily)
MIHPLSDEKIEALLKSEIVGRIGCCNNAEVYIVPTSYAYDGKYIYVHTHEGMKMDLMRKNPNVCFQVDSMKDMAHWKSVVAWGRFEELKEKADREKAFQLLLNRRLPLNSSVTTHLGNSWPFGTDNIEEIDGLFFRIELTKKTGRYESNEVSTPYTV